jgi:hypothetical protein
MVAVARHRTLIPLIGAKSRLWRLVRRRNEMRRRIEYLRRKRAKLNQNGQGMGFIIRARSAL